MDKKNIIKTVELLVLGIGVMLNVSFLHGICLLESTYFEISKEFSSFAVYLTSTIGTLTICNCLVKLFIRFFS